MANGHGGRREGSGRSPEKSFELSAAFERHIEKKYKTTPLHFLMSIVCGEEHSLADKIDAAKAALPYCNRRLAQLHLVGTSEISHEQWLAAISPHEALPESSQIAARPDDERPTLDLEAVEVAA